MKFLLFSVYSSTVAAWGGDGHRIIANLAYSLMDKPGQDFLNTFLGKGRGALEAASVWADSEEAKTAYPKSRAYHFANTAYRGCTAFDVRRHCGIGRSKGSCIVTALTDAIVTAADYSTSDGNRTDAIKFILHLVADIHQPMHLGFREDSGGSAIRLSGPANSNLHDVWDTWIVDRWRDTIQGNDGSVLFASRALREEFDSNQFHVNFKEPREITDVSNKVIVQDGISRIATETIMESTCSFGYTHTNQRWVGVGDRVDYSDYVSVKVEMMKQQMIRSSVRLSSMIEKIADAYYTKKFAQGLELFSAIPEESEDGFAELDLDLDFEKKSVQARPSRKKNKKDKRPVEAMIVSDQNDDELLEAAIAESSLSSYVIDGIDFNSITLLRRNGLNYVTSANLAWGTQSHYEPQRARYLYVRTRNNKLNILLFDIAVFIHNRMDHFTRALLKLAGVDPRIDLTDYMNGGELSLPGAISFERETVTRDGLSDVEIAFWKRAADLRFKVMAFRPTRSNPLEYVKQRISDLRKTDRLVRFATGNVHTFFFESTLQKSDSSVSCLKRIQRFAIQTRKQRVKVALNSLRTFEIYLIDSLIMDFITDGPTLRSIVGILVKAATEIPDSEPFLPRPSIHEELKALDYMFFSQERKKDILTSPKRAAIAAFGEFTIAEHLLNLFVWKGRENQQVA